MLTNLDDIIWMKCPSCGGKGRRGYELGKWYTEAEAVQFTCEKCGGWGVVPDIVSTTCVMFPEPTEGT